MFDETVGRNVSGFVTVTLLRPFDKKLRIFKIMTRKKPYNTR